jgi:hypothetical protein
MNGNDLLQREVTLPDGLMPIAEEILSGARVDIEEQADVLQALSLLGVELRANYRPP